MTRRRSWQVQKGKGMGDLATTTEKHFSVLDQVQAQQRHQYIYVWAVSLGHVSVNGGRRERFIAHWKNRDFKRAHAVLMQEFAESDVEPSQPRIWQKWLADLEAGFQPI